MVIVSRTSPPSERHLSDKLQELALRAPDRLHALETLVDDVLEQLADADRFDLATYLAPAVVNSR